MTYIKNNLFLFLICIVLIFTACGNNNTNMNKNKDKEKKPNIAINDNTNNKTPVENNELDNTPTADNNVNNEERQEVTIKIAMPLYEEYFEGRFREVERRLEHVNLELVPYGNSVESLEELFSSKVNPDIIVGDYGPMKHIDIAYMLDDLIEGKKL